LLPRDTPSQLLSSLSKREFRTRAGGLHLDTDHNPVDRWKFVSNKPSGLDALVSFASGFFNTSRISGQSGSSRWLWVYLFESQLG
jgi:hypothetical protein